jgi:tetratricopeptide (TPR) repeat protein
LLRDAKNHELGGRYENALAVYEEVRTLDPQTPGLNTLIAAAQRGQTGEDLTTHISRGFAALEGRRFADARSAFQAALRLDPNNDIARGGLQQVARQNDLTVIRAHQQQAEAAMSGENWQSAIDAYQAVLALDGNIQFAANGLNDAKAHLRAQRLLTKIASEPSKLSSESLFLQANDIVQSARELQHKGPTIDRLVNEVNELLTLYRDPVDVVLISDNATEIVVSNVGRLGRFERKSLSLRPGQYTIRGSQDGCRDIYLSVEVLPGIAPLNLSCPESLE